jgi:hypothetical protein
MEADLRGVPTKLHGSQNPAVQVGAKMLVQSFLGIPLFRVAELIMQTVFF